MIWHSPIEEQICQQFHKISHILWILNLSIYLKRKKHIKRAPKIDNARVVKSSISFPVVQIETRYTFLCCITKNQKCTNYKFCFAELFFMSTITAEKLCFWKHPPAKSDHKYLPSVKTVGEESYSLYYYC